MHTHKSFQAFLSIFAVMVVPMTVLAQSKVKVVTRTQKAVSLTQDPSNPWLLTDSFCVMKEEKQVACGRIVQVKKKVAFGQIDIRYSDINPGDVAKRWDSIGKKIGGPSFVMSTVNPHEWFNVRDFSIGFNWLAIRAHFQQALTPHVTVGMAPELIFSTSSGAGSMGGGTVVLTVNYYPEYLYHGLWIQGGFGGGLLTGKVGSTEQRILIPAAQAIAGWRWSFPSGLNAAVAAGGQYLFSANFERIGLNPGNFRPAIVAELGWIF